MDKVLNRGLNFSILPLKLDTTQVFVDFKKFERSVIWHEFWHGSEQQEDNNRKYLFLSFKKPICPKTIVFQKTLKLSSNPLNLNNKIRGTGTERPVTYL